MNLSNLITNLVKKAGLDENEKALIDLLSNAELSKIKVNEDFASKLSEGLLSITDAVDNHPQIRSKYLAEFYNAVDKKLEPLVAKLKLTDDELVEFTNTKGTYKRLEKLSELVDIKIGSTGGKGEETEQLKSLKLKVDQLNTELATTKKALQDKDSEFEKIRKQDQQEFLITQKILSRKTSLDNLPEGARKVAYKSLLDGALKNKSLSISLDETGEIVLLTQDGSNYFSKDNKKVSFDDFLTELETENKIHVSADPGKGEGGDDPDRFPKGGGKEPGVGNLSSRIVSAYESVVENSNS